jgi:Protein of unknown function (DUF1350)
MDPSRRKQRCRPRRRASLCALSCASLLDFASSWSLGSFSHSRIPPPGHADGGPFFTNGRLRLVRDGDGSSLASSVDRLPDRRRTDPTRALRSRWSREEDAEEGPHYWESYDVVSKRTRRRDTTNDFDDDEDDFEDGGVEYGGNAYGPSDEEEALEWEACPTADSGTAHVLLPPYMGTSSSSSGDRQGREGGGGRRPPTCVIHFVGGTFFGSSPTVWYGKLLRDVVRHSSAAVIASSIPVTVLQSPLQHVQLAKKVARQFEAAYNDVLVDEYGAEALRTVPICALGHSLGSRLLVVSATLQQQSTSKRRNSDSRRGTGWVTPPSYRSYILMSFTNFGAAAGIPGVGTLYRARRQVDRQEQQQLQQADVGGAQGRRQRRQPQQRRPAGRRPKQGRDGEEFDRFRNFDEELDEDGYNAYDDDDDDADIAGLWEDLTGVVKESARWIQSSLTPDASALEFYPTPAQLWKALRSSAAPDRSGNVNGGGAGEEGAAAGGGRYRVPQTLLIQFDQDRVDQSAKLAATIRACSDVTFARLRGTHLSPLSPNPQSPGSLLSRGVRRQGAASKQQGPVEPTGQALVEQSTLSDLRQTIVRYTTEVVTKGIGQSQDV